MKNIILVLFATLLLSSCSQTGPSGQTYVNSPNSSANTNAVVTPSANLGDNLNLQALGELVRASQNAQTIETKLNDPSTGINNLDLNNDGNVDYINVTEYQNNGTRGFSFTDDLGNGQKQEVATVELQANASGNQATMNIVGNQTLYGSNAYYSSNYLLTDLLIYHYLFYPHSYYLSPYRYGYYPSYYHPYAYARTGYSNRISRYTTTTHITKSTRTISSSSPNRNLSAPSVSQRAQSLSAPTRSQKSFSTTSPSQSRPNTSGFKSSSSSTPSSSRSFWGSSSP